MLLVAGAVLAVVIAVTYLTRRRPHPDATAAFTNEAVFDSASAALLRRDWKAAEYWAELQNVRLPNDSGTKLRLAIALQNHAISHESQGVRSHPITRNSLQHIETKLRILALMDSAQALATTPAEWVQARESYGEVYETLGLPLDALQAYLDVRGRDPSDPKSAGRIVWIRDRLRDPLLPGP